jgi:uncharacterized protein (DUF302 family)
MAKTRERINRTAKQLARSAGKAALAAEKKVEARLRQRRKERLLKRAGKVTAIVGTAALASTAAGLAGRAIGKRVRAHSSAGIGFEVELPVDMEVAVARVTDALKSEGFGILTRIDVRATFQEKLGEEIRPYLILGACNPALAHRALTANREAGLLLPCNVTVEAVENGTLVRIADPAAMLQVGTLKRIETIREVAVEAGARLRRVESFLAESARPVPEKA